MFELTNHRDEEQYELDQTDYEMFLEVKRLRDLYQHGSYAQAESELKDMSEVLEDYMCKKRTI